MLIFISFYYIFIYGNINTIMTILSLRLYKAIVALLLSLYFSL